MEGGVEEVGGGGLGGGEPSVQRVAQAHQLVYLCHDPLLFGAHLADFFRGGVDFFNSAAAFGRTYICCMTFSTISIT